MATLPAANTSINESGNAIATGTGYCTVIACVSQSADSVPRLFSSTNELLAQYGYCPGIDYCALHFQETNLPVIFVGVPVTTAGTIGSINNSAQTGTSQVSLSAAASGIMEQGSWTLTCTQGVNVGTDQIICTLSGDGGLSTQIIRFGTGTTYTIPYVGITITLGLGTLNPGDVITWVSNAPMWGSTALSTAQTSLAGQQNTSRSWLVVGDVPNSTFAGYAVTAINNYYSANQRACKGRVQIADRSPLGTKSQHTYSMTGSPALTFASSGHTITRATGSFVTDGFVIGQFVTVAGSTSNNGGIGVLTNVSATVLTFGSGVVNESDSAGSTTTITASEALTYASTTITRSAGSWVNDGFAVGDEIVIAGDTDNSGNFGPITTLTALVMTIASASFTVEGPEASSPVSLTQSLTMSAWVAAETAAFASIAGQFRVNLGLGRAIVQSPITGWNFRRPAQWAVSIREYQHDLQTPTFEKSYGNLEPFTITNAQNYTVEFDERVYGGGVAGLFTVLRSYANGPAGAFVALDLTRDTDGAFLSRDQNVAVTNLATNIVQSTTENAIGLVLQLNANGTITNTSASLLEKVVNKALQINLLQSPPAGSLYNEGPRASNAVWSASRTDVLSAPGSTESGTLALELNGTLEQITTSIVIS